MSLLKYTESVEINAAEAEPTFFFSWGKNWFPVYPKDQETCPRTIFDKQ